MKRINGYAVRAKQTKEGWTIGTIGKASFEAKVYDEGSCYGINEGRVSKLFIRNGRDHIACYERGWDHLPQTDADQEITDALLQYLENLPTAAFWEEIAEGKSFKTCLEVKPGYPTGLMINIGPDGWAKVQDCLTGMWYKQLNPIEVLELLERRG